jgi:hypothetical protein
MPSALSGTSTSAVIVHDLFRMRGDTAFLITAFSRAFAEDLAGYDHPLQRTYFLSREMQATVYGARPNGGRSHAVRGEAL